MKEFMVRELLDRYEKTIAEATYYKTRVSSHEDDLRKANRQIQQLKVNIELLEEKIEELQKNEQCNTK